MNTTTSRRIAAHYIYNRRSLLKNPILSLSSDGVVTGIEICDDPDSREGVEFYPGILIPPMVNAHCHLELSYLQGTIPRGGGFVAFADGLGKARNDFSPQQRLEAIRAADRSLWQQGVGAVADICNGSTTFATKKEAQIKYRSFLELFGLGMTSCAPLEPVARQAEALDLPYSVTPHSTYSLGKAAFSAAVQGLPSQTPDAPLSIHFMESAAEAELYDGRGDMARWYASRGMEIDLSGFCSPADRLIAQIPAERDIMLIHNCFVTEEVVDKIMDYFTGRITWVLCPRSNDYISRVSPPVEMLRRKGANIAIGTDSLASNDSLDMAAELALLRNVPLEELLEWATATGAGALGMESGFEIGRKCGAVLLGGVDWNRMELTPHAHTRRII